MPSQQQNTTDRWGIHFFFQSALLRGLVNPDEAIINLCASNVSLGNSSYPRGIAFHGDGVDAPAQYLHLPFFPASKRMSPVFGLRSYTKESIEKCIYPKIDTYLYKEMITEETYVKIGDFMKNFVLHETVLHSTNYSGQITLLNNLWWDRLFPDLPSFIPLDAEDIV
jgi:hypothetical protein